MYVSRDLKQWNEFLEILRNAVAEGREQDLLMLLLTADERDTLGLRLQIISHLLDRKLTQREIKNNLNTSVATVTRGSNMLKVMPSEFLNWVKEQLNQQNEK